MSFPCVKYSTKPAKKPVFSRASATFLPSRSYSSWTGFCAPSAGRFATLPSASGIAAPSASAPLLRFAATGTSVLQPFIQQYEPLPSQYSALIRSFRLPQNRNSVLVNGSSWNWLCTMVASPSIPLRKSVYPQAMYTFSAPVKSLSMTSTSSAPALKLPYPLLHERPRQLLLCEW